MEQETGKRNLKDQVLQPQRFRNHGSLVQRRKASRPFRYCLALPLPETELCYHSSQFAKKSSLDSDFAINCRFLKILIIHNFKLNVSNIPKTILSEKKL